MNKVCVIGDGGWGTALALLLNSKGVDTILWSHDPEYAEYIDTKRENVKFLKGISIPGNLRITSSVKDVIGCEFVFFVVPCKYLRSVAERFKGRDFKAVISATKGIENGSLERPSEILSDYFEPEIINVLSGPSISFEVIHRMPTTVVLAGSGKMKSEIQALLTTDNFRVYTANDIIGVEIGGALKNVVAIAAGISDGLGYGTNSKAAILTRGLAEIIRLGQSLGADKNTFSGLSGIGDLATTCISTHSRNRRFGEQLGRGRQVNDILNDSEMVVEGIDTCKSAYELAVKYNVEMPITQKIYEIIYAGKEPVQAVKELMSRNPKDED